MSDITKMSFNKLFLLLSLTQLLHPGVCDWISWLPFADFIVQTVSPEEFDEQMANLYCWSVPGRKTPDSPKNVDWWCRNLRRWHRTFDTYITQRTIEEGALIIGQLVLWTVGSKFKRHHEEWCDGADNREKLMRFSQTFGNYSKDLWPARKALANGFTYSLDSEINYEILAICCGYWEWEEITRKTVKEQEAWDFWYDIMKNYHRDLLEVGCVSHRKDSDSCKRDMVYPQDKFGEPRYLSLHYPVFEIAMHDLSIRGQLKSFYNRLIKGDTNLKLPIPMSISDILQTAGFTLTTLISLIGDIPGMIIGAAMGYK